MKTAVIYASEHGSSTEVAEFIARRLDNAGLDVSLLSASERNTFTLDDYEVVILGAPIYKGIWHRDMLRFLIHKREILASKRVFAWITCVRILETDGLAHIHEHYLQGELNQLSLELPIGIFAGKLTYEQLTDEDRWTFYLRYDGNALMKQVDGDFRDWGAISQWADDVIAILR